MTKKICTKCKEEKELTEYYKRIASKDGLRSHCITCTNIYGRANAKTPKGLLVSRSSTLRQRGCNIKTDELASLLKKYTNCQICDVSFKDAKSHVDHDHQTGEVRGVLCQRCNHLLGNAKDNVQILQNAIKYLDRQW